MEEPANEARESPLPQEVAQGQPLPLRFIGVMLASVGVTLWLCRIYFGDSTPELTHKRSQEAESRWQASQVLDYNLQVVLQKAKPELFEIQVRGGRPRQATLNGTPLTETRAMETWTVPGMFTTIQEDLAISMPLSNGPPPKQLRDCVCGASLIR